LENICGCGFFVDGEQVPKSMCFDPKKAAADKAPAFRDRYWNSDYGHWSLKKQQSLFLDYFAALINEYGTDHLYHCSAFCETEVHDNPDKSFRIKMRITEDVVSLLKELDPDMRYVYDSWDYACFPNSSWKKEHIIKHLDSLPAGTYIYETAFDM
jgi:hypothetical protein